MFYFMEKRFGLKVKLASDFCVPTRVDCLAPSHAGRVASLRSSKNWGENVDVIRNEDAIV